MPSPLVPETLGQAYFGVMGEAATGPEVTQVQLLWAGLVPEPTGHCFCQVTTTF